MSDTGSKSDTVLVILAVFSVPDAARAEFLVEIAADADGSVSNEPGCRGFDVLESETDPTSFTLLETYDDAAAFEAHLQTPHYARFDAAVKRLGLAAPTVHRLSRQHRGTRGGDAA